MKNAISIGALLATFLLSAQSANYYNTATGTGYTLKTQLYDIIKGHSDQGYGALWTFYQTADVRSDGFVWDIYADCDLVFGTDQDNGSGGGSECDKYNREHTFPKSWFDDASPMHNDGIMVLPTDKKVNNVRSNFPYGEVVSTSYTSGNMSKLGSSSTSIPGYSGSVFEPADEFKGDIARIYFYMATRYENVIAGWENNSTESDAMLNGTSDQAYEDWVIEMLLDWHLNDPVSTKEEDRNNAAETFQGNRNPFVDHPEWVNEIWDDGTTPTITLSESSFDFGNIDAGMSSSSQNYTVSGTNLSTGVSVSVSAPFEISLNNSSWSQSVTVTEANAETGSSNIVYVRFSPTTSNGQSYNQSISHTSTGASTVNLTVSGKEGTASSGGADLFISEYLEGSSNNKAIEIYNGTGSSVDLSDYSLDRYNNGSSTSSFSVTLSGSLANNEVYVIGNSSAVQAILDESDITNDLTFFNGNDAIALFKNGTLIDLIGVIGTDPGTSWTDGSHSTAGKTLVRKETINEGNANGFDPITNLSLEWDVYSEDETSYLGSHTFSPPASVFTWDGSSSSDWSNVSNWQGGAVPTVADNVLIPNVGTSPIISGDYGVNGLEIASGASVTINSGASLAIYGSVSGSGNAIVKRNTTGNKGYSISGSPIPLAAIQDVSPDFAQGYDASDFVAASGSMNPGVGYFIGYDAASPSVTFTGTPNSGTITKSVTSGNYELVANPYPAAISIEDFLAENSSTITGTVYFWDDGGSNIGAQRGGDYVATNGLGVAGTSTANLSDGVSGITGSSPAENGYIPSVQGVFVQAIATGNVKFTPEMQAIDASANSDANHYRSTNFQKIKLAIAGKEVYNDILIGLGEEATIGEDYGLDASKLSGNECISFYSIQEENHYVIQAIPLVDFESRLKLGFSVSEEGNYEFKVQNLENFPSDLSIGLLDKQTKRTFDLRTVSSFSFGSAPGVYDDRFEILFTKGSILGLRNDVTTFTIEGSSNRLTLGYESNEVEVLKIYTLGGKMVFNQPVKFDNNNAQIEVDLKEDQTYVLRLNNESIKFTIK